MIVMKFGGTSVKDATCMDQALDIVLKRIDKKPIMISSAMSQMTNSLVKLSELADKGKKSEITTVIDEMLKRHYDAANEFLTGNNLSGATSRLNELEDELRSLAKGLAMLKECTTRSMDSILSFGELLSTTLLAYRIKERGFKSTLLDSRELIKTDSNYSNADVNFLETNSLIKKAIIDTDNMVYVAQGFISSTSSQMKVEGVTTTLGRGGSDYSASIFGAAIGAKEIQIWTDVNGIMTTDPRISPKAKTVEQITYEEAAELAFFGAKVIHPSTMQPAIKDSIPVLVLNTKDSDGSFTKITTDDKRHGLEAIAGKKNVTMINITTSRMVNSYGFLNKIFSTFETHKTPVDLISTSEVSVSMTIDDDAEITEIVSDLEKIGTVSVESNVAIICLVGQNLWQDTKFLAKVFYALTPIEIRMISLGSSDTNLSCVVPQDKMNKAISQLHTEFFE